MGTLRKSDLEKWVCSVMWAELLKVLGFEAQRTPGLQDGVSCTSEGQETSGGQTGGAAKLDLDAGLQP